MTLVQEREGSIAPHIGGISNEKGRAPGPASKWREVSDLRSDTHGYAMPSVANIVEAKASLLLRPAQTTNWNA